MHSVPEDQQEHSPCLRKLPGHGVAVSAASSRDTRDLHPTEAGFRGSGSDEQSAGGAEVEGAVM